MLNQSVVYYAIQAFFVLRSYRLLAPLPTIYVSSLKSKQPTLFYRQIFVIYCNYNGGFFGYAIRKVGENRLGRPAIQIEVVPVQIASHRILKLHSLVFDDRENHNHIFNMEAQIPGICNFERS